METTIPPFSGRIYTDALIAGPKWAGNALTFSFPFAPSQYTGYPANGEQTVGFRALDASQQAAVRTILTSISAFTNLTFTELTGTSISSATLRFGMTADMGSNEVAYAYLPSSSEYGGDSWYNPTPGYNDNPAKGNDPWHTFLHEIGHTLGLGHPQEAEPGEPAMPRDRDWMAYTVMSYNSTLYVNGYRNAGYWDFAQTYMMEDMAALQFMYGANYNTNNSNSTYQWNPSTGEMTINGVGQGAPGGNKVFLTVWDGGGNDTYDLSNYAFNSATYYAPTIDLRPGGWVTLPSEQAPNLGGVGLGNVANALLFNGNLASLIENAIGTGWNDDIHGNQVANTLTGGGGNDTINGYQGDDVLNGGTGIDRLDGGDGADKLYGGDQFDQLYGGTGDDLLDGGGDDDYLYGQAGADLILAGDGNDILGGGEGDDRLEGNGGNDALRGDAGNDLMIGGAGDDTYWLEDAGDQIVEQANEGTDLVYTAFSYVAGANIEKIQVIGTVAANLTGNALANTIFGSGLANIIDGGAGADIMVGNGGGDIFYVDNDGDSAIGSAGDTVFSSANITLVDTNPYYDPYAGASVGTARSAANSIDLIILTGSANLSATGNSSSQTISGNAGDNSIDGKDGADIITGGGGADTLIGGLGADIFRYTAASDSVYGAYDYLSDFAHGVDLVDLRELSVIDLIFSAFPDGASSFVTINLSGGASMLLRMAGVAGRADFLLGRTAVGSSDAADTLTGSDNDDNLYGFGGNDTLNGAAGNDLLDGGTGDDALIGGSGNDIYDVDSAGDRVLESAGGGYDTVYARINYTLAADVERVLAHDSASTAALNLTGNALDNEISGNAGANVIDGGAGADFMTGRGGNDIYFVDNTGDYVFELTGDGFDTVFATASYTLGSAVERVIAFDTAGTASINFTGNELDNEITGNAGANVIDGGAGADFMVGRTGNDIYFVDDPGDYVFEDIGEGYDTVFTTVSYSLGSTVERVLAYDPTVTTALNLTGNSVDNEISGNAGANVIDGGAGADLMNGLGGNDIYFVDSAGDRVLEAAGGGYDTVFSSISHTLAVNVERLLALDPGATTSLSFSGNSAANEISGNAGGNLIDGGLGADVLRGNGGADAFAFTTALGSGNIDTLLDYTAGTDKFYLDDAVFGALASGALSPAAFRTGTAAQDADDRIIYDPATGALYYDADGNGSGAAVQFAVVSGGGNLTANDFHVI